ncbi:DUF4329 domain-containing protein [Aestuariibius sp. 2305UL40-4]|uniref:DUF4329 domain-containing protein n=1 Tax=Aestuariibius violaceus TaxID=3234132 RepID=UPI00345EBB2F
MNLPLIYSPLTKALLALAFSASAAISQDAGEAAFAKALADRIQPISFKENRELCGYIGRDVFGNPASSEIRVGTYATCTLPPWPDKLDVTATFHTHSTYHPDYISEFPSPDDIESDLAKDLNGYIATPGGRLWFNDTAGRTIRLICTTGCVPQDPEFQKETTDPDLSIYSHAHLRKIFSN